MYFLRGIQVVDYTNKSGRHVSGYRLHFEDTTQKDVTGIAYFSGFVSADNVIGDLVLGEEYQVIADRRSGRIFCVRLLTV